ncbi:MAG: hypothetical protein SFW35_05695 [Chitinophagales bacterium]|nr:hypothetical protein [Chitinophagales bacterium]
MPEQQLYIWKQQIMQKINSAEKWQKPNTVYYANFLLSDIDAARNAYMYAKTSSKKNPIAKPDLASLENLVNNFVAFNGIYSDSFKRNAIQYHDNISIAELPSVSEGEAVLTEAGNSLPITVTLRGNFIGVQSSNGQSYISAGSNKLPISNLTDSTLTFILDANTVMGLIGNEPFRYAIVEVHLAWLPVRKVSKKYKPEVHFSVPIVSIPITVGTIEVLNSVTTNGVEKQQKRTRTFLLNSSNQDLVEKQCITVPDGWSLIPESLEFVVEKSVGKQNREWSYRKTVSGGKTCFVAETFYNNSGTSGKLEFHIKYDIERKSKESNQQADKKALLYGSSFTLAANNNSVITFTDYQNHTVNIDLKNLPKEGIVKWQASNGSLIINVPTVAELVHP